MDTTSITIKRCAPLHDHRALQLAMSAWPAAEREAYECALLALVQSGEVHKIVLASAQLDGQLVAAQLGQALSGRAAIIWPPRFVGGGQENLANEPFVIERLFNDVTEGLSAAGASMVQGLTDPTDQLAASQYLAGRFWLAAELLYLTAPPLPEAVQRPLPFELRPFRDQDEPRLAAIMDRSYVGTLDCPSLDSLRKTADVIEGYRAVGQFDPALWHFVIDRAEDCGCLLLNRHPDVRHLEIVYLALTPEARGCGWGLELAMHARRVASWTNCERVVLAVDTQNTPAIRLYQQAGFQEFDRRAIWIRSLLPNIPK